MNLLNLALSLFKSNLPAKILSLGLAVAVWFALDAEITDKIEQEVPVDVILQGSRDWEIMKQDVHKVRIVLKGTRSDVARAGDLVLRERLRGVVRIGDEQIGEPDRLEVTHSVALTPACFNAQPLDLKIEAIVPPSIQVTLVRMGEKDLRVIPALVGSPEKGYVVQKVKVTPSRVAVRGPRIALDGVEEIESGQVFLFGRDESFEDPAGVASKVGEYPVSAARQVVVQVTISKEPGRKLVERVPLKVIYPRNWAHDRFKIEIDERRDVTVSGPAELVERVGPEDLLLTAELDTLAYERWMNEESDTQHAMAPIRCSVTGPNAEARRAVQALLADEELVRFKVIRLKGK